MRLREKKYIVLGDIEKMFLQIWIHPDQRDLLRFVWSPDPSSPAQHYRLNTVMFGTACAPYLATRTILQIAIDNEYTFPQAAAIMKNSFYVDDAAFGFDTIDETATILHHIRYMLNKSGMKLRKLISNEPYIIQDVPEPDRQPIEETQTLKTLGINYDAVADRFFFKFELVFIQPATKANILSNIASMFDPLGWIGPIVLTAKLIMKSIWLHHMKWTDLVPNDIQLKWKEFCEQFPSTNSISIDRRCVIDNHTSIEVHGFCDASIHAYGAVIYIRSINDNGHVKTAIICAKSRVAPKKQQTLPRLELSSAVLLAKLMDKVHKALTLSANSVTLWSDSTITLNWIAMNASQLKTFVGNRVAIINELTHKFVWRHIPGEMNPADVISRGLMPNELENCNVWWHGPTFFNQPKEQWPESILTVLEDNPEVIEEIKGEYKRALIVLAPSDLFVYIQSRYSNTRKVYRVFAYVRRFIDNCRHKAQDVTLRIPDVQAITVDETSVAEVTVIRIIQQELFAEEYNELSKQLTQSQRNKSKVLKKSTLKSLDPFMDDHQIIRIGGRIDNCLELSYDQRHPIIMPACPFTKNLVREVHQNNIHPGPSATMSFVRTKYWLIKGKSIIRQVIHECLPCFKIKPIESNQFMSDLPSARVTLTRPFVNTALDYAGYFLIRTSTTRNSSQTKCYVALFKCMCTGAIHLEVVSDLTSKAFIAALDRFVSRRGKPSKMFSDNATCFHGADKELKGIVSSFDGEVAQYCSDQVIKWQFTTPGSPHAGGIYESGIKNMKHHLKRIMERSYTFEQFTTILCKIEAILNSRPLTPLSNDPKDLQVLTPGHFLIGAPLNAIPQHNLVNVKSNVLKIWDGLQQVQQKFWHAWYRDYLPTLQERPAGFRQRHEFKIGDMVLVRDPNLPPMKWLLGRISKLFPSRKDKIVRNVEIITQQGTKERHIKYLSFLPMEATGLIATIGGPQCVPAE